MAQKLGAQRATPSDSVSLSLEISRLSSAPKHSPQPVMILKYSIGYTVLYIYPSLQGPLRLILELGITRLRGGDSLYKGTKPMSRCEQAPFTGGLEG